MSETHGSNRRNDWKFEVIVAIALALAFGAIAAALALIF